MKYIGIADCHGLESIIPEGVAKPGILSLRAGANRQRHAMVYRIELSDSDYNIIGKLVKHGEPKAALETLKNLATNIEIEKGFERSWGMIPDDKLDPYWGRTK